MRTKVAIILCALLCGCAAPNQMLLVNNTPYFLKVTSDSGQHFTNLHPGEVLAISPTSWVPRTGVAVSGYDRMGHYVGANDWTFYNGQSAQIWRVDRLQRCR